MNPQSETTPAISTPVPQSATVSKRTAKAKVDADLSGKKLTFVFANGKTHVVELAKFSAEILERFAMHGAEQKFRDSYASSQTPDEAESMFLKVQEHVGRGVWSERGPRDEEAPIELLAQAYRNARLAADPNAQVEPVEAYVEKLKAMDPGKRATVRKHEQVAQELIKLRSKGQPAAKLDELL